MILEVCHPNPLIGELFQVKAISRPQSLVLPAPSTKKLHTEYFIAEVMMRPC